MKKTAPKKLKLARETLKQLDTDQIARAAGGLMVTSRLITECANLCERR